MVELYAGFTLDDWLKTISMLPRPPLNFKADEEAYTLSLYSTLLSIRALLAMKGGSNISLKAVYDSLAFSCGISDGLSCSMSAICVL